MDDTSNLTPRFPKELVEWAGHHSGGVKRLFDSHSGRPGGDLLRTNLLGKLESWATLISSGTPNTPRILLLVGGPGNGKTEAIEHTINCMDDGLAANGKLIETLSNAFHPPAGQAVSRVVSVDAGCLAAVPRPLELSIVQDASATAGQDGRSAPELLIDELRLLQTSSKSRHYLCCVNRGVLDDSLIYALDHGIHDASALLEAITRSVSLSSDAPSCWPLEGYPDIAIWPMDAESLLTKPDDATESPASALLNHATESRLWPGLGKCQAGENCPFCYSQTLLASVEQRTALLQVLRWYELASGKRWSFRDLFSLISYLLSGNRPAVQGQQANPCDWANRLAEMDKSGRQSATGRPQELTSIFHLATSGYQNALFHRWDKSIANTMRHAIKELDLDKSLAESRTILGLQHFLAERRASYLPATISSLLDSLANLLDPALASPDSEISISNEHKVSLGELDTMFSRSVSGGLEFIKKYRFFSASELEMLKRLSKADNMLSAPSIRRKRPAAGSQLQRILRDFACRFVRRSICTRFAVTADAQILKAFQQVVEDDEQGQRRLFEVAKQVKNLLNSRNGFQVSLTTTFGQPLPPLQRQATLVVPVRPVRMLPLLSLGRPRSPICFLEVGSGHSSQPIALTYDLFKAVKELDRGLSPASLPRTVVALLDTTKARLSGPIVRDGEILVDARILIGADGTEVGTSWRGGFIALDAERRQ